MKQIFSGIALVVFLFVVANGISFVTLSSDYRAVLSGEIGAGNVGVSNSEPLPNLGFYHDKLFALQKSITEALVKLKKKRDAAHIDKKGGEALVNDPALDGPFYLLTKMQQNLETDENGSLKDPAGFDKFFIRVHALETYRSPDFSDVISRTYDLTGFLYLFPPSPDKPTLVFVPGAGGEPGWRGGLTLLNEEAKSFNIIGYTYDATVPAADMVRILLEDFTRNELNARASVILTMSLGNTLTHGAILKDALEQGDAFSKSFVVSAGFLPGGSSKFLGKPSFIPPLAGIVFPPYAEIFKMMNPVNPLQSNIATHIGTINAATQGISYIQANGDDHVNLKSTDSMYAPNRTLIFNEISGKVTYVSPPEIYEKNNAHVNLLYAPAVKTKIDLYRNSLVIGKKQSILPSHSLSYAMAAIAATPTTPSSLGMFAFGASLVGESAAHECHALSETLEDEMAIRRTNSADTVSSVETYLASIALPCTIDSLTQGAKTDLQNILTISAVSTSPSVSIPPPPSSFDSLGDEGIFSPLSLTLKVNGSHGPITIKSGDRIVVSWISEGATRCRAVWSKNDIALSGTIAGRLRRPLTIRAACIDADKNRVDDAVEVNISAN